MSHGNIICNRTIQLRNVQLFRWYNPLNQVKRNSSKDGSIWLKSTINMKNVDYFQTYLKVVRMLLIETCRKFCLENSTIWIKYQLFKIISPNLLKQLRTMEDLFWETWKSMLSPILGSEKLLLSYLLIPEWTFKNLSGEWDKILTFLKLKVSL